MVFGRGGEEALALRRAGIPFEVVPGVTSAVGALSALGLPLTHRGLARSFAVATGHDPALPSPGRTPWSSSCPSTPWEGSRKGFWNAFLRKPPRPPRPGGLAGGGGAAGPGGRPPGPRGRAPLPGPPGGGEGGGALWRTPPEGPRPLAKRRKRRSTGPSLPAGTSATSGPTPFRRKFWKGSTKPSTPPQVWGSPNPGPSWRSGKGRQKKGSSPSTKRQGPGRGPFFREKPSGSTTVCGLKGSSRPPAPRRLPKARREEPRPPHHARDPRLLRGAGRGQPLDRRPGRGDRGGLGEHPGTRSGGQASGSPTGLPASGLPLPGLPPRLAGRTPFRAGGLAPKGAPFALPGALPVSLLLALLLDALFGEPLPGSTPWSGWGGTSPGPGGGSGVSRPGPSTGLWGPSSSPCPPFSWTSS